MSKPETDNQDAKTAMDNMYRWTRHVYDASRKYYLLGRDQLISHLDAQPGQHICEIGCGTARNLIKMAKAYPQARFYGVDVSDEMLKTAQGCVDKSKTDIKLAQGYAQNFAPEALFNKGVAFEKVVFSYALSIIPPWKDSLDHALTVLPKNGEIHVVDFHDMGELPVPFRRFIFWWLKLFHVYHKPEILQYLQQMVIDGKGTLETKTYYNGYTYLAVFKKI